MKEVRSKPVKPLDPLVFVYDKDTGLYVYPGGSYIINGERYPSLTVCTEKPTSVYKTQSNTEVTHYTTANDEEQIPIDEYEKQIKRLESKAIDSTNAYELEWENIEDEVAYQRFARKWVKSIYETKENRIEVPFIIKERPVSQYNEITPFNSDKALTTVNMTLCIYQINLNTILKEVCNHFGIRFINKKSNDKKDINSFYYYPSANIYSILRFSQIGNQYPIKDYEAKYNNLHKRFIGSYEDCVQKRKENIQTLINLYKPFILSLNKEEMTSKQIGTVYKEMKYIFDKLHELDPKRKDDSKMSVLKKRVKEYIQELEKLLEESK